MINKVLCKFGKYLCDKYCNKKYNYIPELSNEELSSIKLEQAKFIHTNAMNALVEIEKSADYITEKAHSIFKYLIIIIFVILSLYFFYKDKIILTREHFYYLIILFTITILLYIYYFLKPHKLLSIHNTPIRTITKRALEDMQVFYLLESIDIQEYAIPKNLKYLNNKIRGLMIFIISILINIIYLFNCFF